MSSAALLLERLPDRSSAAPVGPRDDGFEREANEVSERLAWRLPKASPSAAPADAPLPLELQTSLESELPYDLSEVRLHTGARAEAATGALGARAVTLGSHIAFARGAYDPQTRDGRRTLVHEVVHTAQQGAVPGRPGGGGVSRSRAGVAQRSPGQDPGDTWDALIGEPAFDPDTEDRRTRGKETKSRFLQIPGGKRVLLSLWRYAMPQKKLEFRIGVSFVDALPPGAGSKPADGWTTPPDDWATHYDVYLKNAFPPDPRSTEIRPTQTASGVWYYHTDPESAMATTLVHELVHVEFVRGHLGGMDYKLNPPQPKIGHGDDPLHDTDPLFLRRETEAHNQMDLLEAELHKKAAELKAQQEEKQRADERKREEEEQRNRPAPPPETKPSSVGAQVFAEGGGGSGLAARGAGIVGVDLVLGRIEALHVGARGVYLNPGHLFVGATFGRRFINEDKPVFFDLEAGILAEFDSVEGERLGKHVAAIAAGAFGHEFGTSGTRAFVKVGGFVIVNDQGQAAGGASAGFGVRFQGP